MEDDAPAIVAIENRPQIGRLAVPNTKGWRLTGIRSAGIAPVSARFTATISESKARRTAARYPPSTSEARSGARKTSSPMSNGRA
jgi:hypothetical protein